MTRTSLCGILAMAAAALAPPDGALAQDFADSATADLVRRARHRHQVQDSRIAGYRAQVYTRMEGGAGAGRFSGLLNVFAYESLARIHWQRPNDLRVDLEGMRTRSFRLPGVSDRHVAGFWTEVFSSEPWFVPRTLGTRIQIFGVPDEPAVHPLAANADRFYRYAIADSITLVMPGRTVRAVAVQIEPTVYGPMLVSGRMWLDADSLDVVRLTVAFVGDRLWEDEDDSPTLVEMEADLEYGLHHGQYWLPLRQILTGAWTYRYMPGTTLTSTAISTFSNYEINPAEAIAFEQPYAHSGWAGRHWHCDFAGAVSPRTRCGEQGMRAADDWEDGWWEINVPPLDTLLEFDFKREFVVHADLLDEELLLQRVTEMAEFSEALPYGWTGRRWLTLDWTEALRFVGFNRVHGLSAALGTEIRTGLAFTTVSVTGRFGTADERLTGALALRRAAPRGRLELSAFRRLLDVEPWTNGLGFGNTAKALVMGHDDADYYLATGAAIAYRGHRGVARDLDLYFGFERQQSVARAARSVLHDVFFGDGEFQENPSIADGDFVRVAAQRRLQMGSVQVRAGSGVLAGDGELAGRVWGSVWFPFDVEDRAASLRLRAGATYGDRLPQFDFRLGGPATVRGFRYGVERGTAFWSAQAEVVLVENEWVAPVVFADVGGLFDGRDPLVGAGMGASLFKGWMRLDLSKGITPGAAVRVDIVFQAPQ